MEKIDFLNIEEIAEKQPELFAIDHFKKGETIERAGVISKKLYFIKEGLIRTYYNIDGKDITCYFAREKEPITGIDSFFSQTPTMYHMEALENTTTYSVSNQQLERLYENHPSMERKGRLFMTASYIQLVERFNSVIFKTAEERYTTFIESEADLLLRVPLGQIASYLGMTQETLSRIRAKKQ